MNEIITDVTADATTDVVAVVTSFLDKHPKELIALSVAAVGVVTFVLLRIFFRKK